MYIKNNLRMSFTIVMCVFVRRMFCFSLAVHLNPLERFWSSKERNLNYPFKFSSIENFRSFSCAGRANQLYPDLSSHCYNYFRCLGGVTYSYSCKNGNLFDLQSKQCRPKEMVNCPTKPPSTKKCLHQPDGFYPDYDDECSSYYRCYNGSVEEMEKCEGDSIWDSATGSCGSGKHVVCSPPSCLGLKKGFYPLQGSFCTAYFSCSEGYRTDMLCPFGSIFDYMKKQCVSGPDAVCYERACEDRVNGLYSSPQAACETFYKCFNGAMIQLEECPPDQIFDGRMCVYRSNFSCWRDGHGSCENKQNGYYPLEDSDCRGFFYCKNQIMIRSFQCDEELVYNGEKCVDSSNFICAPKPPIPDCSQKFDGYYTIEKTNCQMFFRCEHGKKISEHNCPSNQVFNGQHCVNPLFHSCTLKISEIERALPDNGVYTRYNHEYYESLP